MEKKWTQAVALPKAAAFVRLFREPSAPLDTKKFLVFAGPTGLGKTLLVRCQFPLGAVLELNCGRMDTVCITGFDNDVHECILWDECRTKLVSENRQVFHTPAQLVALQHTAGDTCVRRNWLNESSSVKCSYRWEEDVRALPQVDAAWLRGNSIVLQCTDKFWRQYFTQSVKPEKLQHNAFAQA